MLPVSYSPILVDAAVAKCCPPCFTQNRNFLLLLLTVALFKEIIKGSGRKVKQQVAKLWVQNPKLLLSHVYHIAL